MKPGSSARKQRLNIRSSPACSKAIGRLKRGVDASICVFTEKTNSAQKRRFVDERPQFPLLRVGGCYWFAGRAWPVERPWWAALILLLGACDGGLAPPEFDRTGVIESIVRYAGEWPPADSVRDLRFVAMRFVPRDTADFLELNRLAISDRLTYRASAETVVVSDVRPGVFVYSGVAVNYAESIFAWRPVGVYEQNDGVFEVRTGETTHVFVSVDFDRPPIFPPPP